MKANSVRELIISCKQSGIDLKKVKYINCYYIECRYKNKDYIVVLEDESYEFYPHEGDYKEFEIKRNKIISALNRAETGRIKSAI